MKKLNGDEKMLFEAILALETEEECADFFDDICTVKELHDISQRLCVARMLSAGEKYQTIEAATGASTATISRVNKCLVYGNGGYREILRRIESRKAAETEGAEK